MPGKNEENGKQAGSPAGNTATAVRGQVKEIGGPWPPGFHPLPFQALRASFPEGKPARARFETHVGLTDEKVLWTNDSIHKQEGSPSGELRDSGERAGKRNWRPLAAGIPSPALSVCFAASFPEGEACSSMF